MCFLMRIGMGQLSKVGKSNELIQASYKLSLSGQRVFILLLAKIDTRKPLESSYTLTSKEYASTYGVNLKNAYRDVGKGVNELYETDIRIHNEPMQVILRKRIANEIAHYYGQGKISVSFPQSLAPHLCEFKERFTTYQVGQVSGLKSAYSIRLYELLIQFRKTGERCISVENFRKWLGLEKKHVLFANLRRRVIEPAIKELNLRTSLNVNWKPIKNGQKTASLSFEFEEVTYQHLPTA